MAKKIVKEEEIKSEKNNSSNLNTNSFSVKLLIFVGVIVLSLITVFVMKYFFVDKNGIGINYSTEKRLEYIELEGQKELISTQKYVSELGYNMRYDVERFKVFNYKNQDIYKLIDNERVLVLIEKASLPSDCSAEPLKDGYNNCYKYIDETMDEYYVSFNNKTYRIIVKTPNDAKTKETARVRISYMINSFRIND